MDAGMQLAAALARAAAAEARAAASERARAAATEQLAAATSNCEAAQQQLAALRLGLPSPPPPPPPPLQLRAFASVAAVMSVSAPRALPSPSKATAEESIQASLASVDLCAPPLSPGLAALAAAGRSLAAWCGEPADAMLREEAAYPHATAHVPAWVVARTRGGPGSATAETAATLFLGRGHPAHSWPAVPGVAVPWTCYPELLTAGAPFHPAFNGAVKSAMSAGEGSRLHMFDELTTYAMLGMLAAGGGLQSFEIVPAATAGALLAAITTVAGRFSGAKAADAASLTLLMASASAAAAIGLAPRLGGSCVGGMAAWLLLGGLVWAWSRSQRTSIEAVLPGSRRAGHEKKPA
jgi:hypothetical protein